VVLTRIGDRRLLRLGARLAALAALASALALAGCGRKGSLDPPPSASAVAPPAPDDRSLGQLNDPNTPGFLRAPSQNVATAPPPATSAPPPPRTFFLDFLIK
jgi:predicted small lipoprotein YifL